MNLSQSGPNPPELLIASHLPLNLNEKSIGDGLILSRWDSLLSESQIEAAGLSEFDNNRKQETGPGYFVDKGIKMSICTLLSFSRP
jgi:hypothetical protein